MSCWLKVKKTMMTMMMTDMETKITVGYWERRDGKRARVLATDVAGELPVVWVDDEGYAYQCHADGTYLSTMQESFVDLIKPWVDKPIVDWSKERDWVKAIAKDLDQRWWRLDAVPKGHDGIGWRAHTFGSRMHPSEYPTFSGDWKDSLIIRPS